jgi:hypothetical protein
MATLRFKRGSGIPAGLSLGEPAYDFTNNRLYVGVTGGVALVGASGAIGVASFNGLTGAVFGVTNSVANIFGPLQTFTNGVRAGSTTTRIDTTSDTIRSFFSSEANPRFEISRDTLTSGQAGIGFNDTSGTIAAAGAAVGCPTTRTLGFYTSNGSALTQRATIDSNGQANFLGIVNATVGISSAGGTFSSQTRFLSGITASGGATFNGQIIGQAASFSGLIISTAGFSGTGITLSGNLSAATKSFLIPHPLQPEKKLQYACLEGPENGVYVRGRLTGTNIIELPDYWTALVHEDSITVQLTSFGEHKNYFVKSIQGNKVTIGPRSKDTDCFYLVQGERKDVPRLTVEY